MPANGNPDDVFNVVGVGDPERRKTLKPRPETVEKAITKFTSINLGARYADGIEVHVTGSTEDLQKFCGLRVQSLVAGSLTSIAFFDSHNTAVPLYRPPANHPLAGLVVAIYLPTNPAALTPPDALKQNRPWGKINKYDVWPHELRKRLGVKMDADEISLSEPATAKTFIDDRTNLGYGVSVSIVDSGIDILHSYFSEGLGLDGDSLVARFQIRAAGTITKQEVGCRIYQFRSDLDNFKLALVELNDLMYRPPTAGALPPPIERLKKPADRIRQSRLANFLPNWYCQPRLNENPSAPAARSAEVNSMNKALQELAAGRATTRVNFQSLIDWIKLEVDPWLKRLSDLLTLFGTKPVDNDGHGTGMAASLLGVARNADLVMYYGLISPELRENYGAFVSFAAFLEEGFDTAVNKAREQQHRLTLERIKNSAKITEHRIISNSWGLTRSVADVLSPSPASADIVRWSYKVGRATDQGCVVIFAAGNAGNPQRDDFSVQAATGPSGAIVVGGAWDTGPDSTGKTEAVLSTAAHAFVLPTNTRIPSVCGLVGVQLTNGTSPYVYYPTKGNDWSYSGGGTSSAAAQVAGVCATIRAQWPNLAPLKIKELLIGSGDPVTTGLSYQRADAADFKPGINRVNISKAVQRAAGKAAELFKKNK